jgi:signal peptidase
MTSQNSGTHPAVARARRGLVNLAAVVVLLGALAMVAGSVLGYERYVITGGSMSGTIERGSLVFDSPVPVDRLRVGDIITYQPPRRSGVSGLVTHRIHTLRHTATGVVLRTRGDANPGPDPWRFRLDAPVQPRVDLAVPQVGQVFIFLGDRTNRMLVIGLPAAMVALVSLRELLLALRRPRRSAAERAADPAPAAGA